MENDAISSRLAWSRALGCLRRAFGVSSNWPVEGIETVWEEYWDRLLTGKRKTGEEGEISAMELLVGCIPSTTGGKFFFLFCDLFCPSFLSYYISYGYLELFVDSTTQAQAHQPSNPSSPTHSYQQAQQASTSAFYQEQWAQTGLLMRFMFHSDTPLKFHGCYRV